MHWIAKLAGPGERFYAISQVLISVQNPILPGIIVFYAKGY